jgi:hypothetical protein
MKKEVCALFNFKLFGFLAALYLLILSFSSIVSAQDLARGSEQLVQIVKDVFGPVFQALLGGSTELLFEKILFLILLFLVVYIALKRVPAFRENLAVLWIISLSVAFLGTRFLSDILLARFVLFSYTVMGVAIMTILPLIIYFYFVETTITSSAFRRIAWLIFFVIFFGLWITKKSEIGNLAYIYLVAAILSLVFMLFDRTIQASFLRSAMQRGLDADKVRAIADLERRIAEDTQRLAYATGRIATQLEENIKRNKRQLKSLYRI